MTLAIELDNEAKWWVDSSYAVHTDIKSLTGIYMTLGKGPHTLPHAKQNTKSSMEAELVAVDNAMGQVLWARHF